jgi:hypothetical protein
MSRTKLVTIRFTPQEMRRMRRYLASNPAFDSISSLGRVATLTFMETQPMLKLQPARATQTAQRPTFLWDYDLTEAQIRTILTDEPLEQRAWLIARILERLRLTEVLDYLTLEQIREALPHLRMDARTKQHWEEAITLWISVPSRS